MYLKRIEILKNEPIVIWEFTQKQKIKLTTVDLIYHSEFFEVAKT